MTRLINFAMIAAFAISLTACATPAPAPQQDYTAPARKLDAKTQLETGRTR